MGVFDEDLIDQREHQIPNADPVAPGQQAAAAQTALAQTPSGPVPLAFDVRAIYDSRPINAYDFNIAVSTSGEVANPITMSFTVPNGYVCVLKRIITFIENPIPASSDRVDVLLTALVNQGVFPFNESIPVGVDQSDLFNCFIIADQGSEVAARLVVSAAILALAPTYTAQFYGQFLQKTNIPPAFEIGNPSGKPIGNPNLIPIVPDAPRARTSTPSVQRVAPAASAPLTPPFPIEWSPILDSNPRRYMPVAVQGRSKRVLTANEQFTYREFLAATKPG